MSNHQNIFKISSSVCLGQFIYVRSNANVGWSTHSFELNSEKLDNWILRIVKRMRAINSLVKKQTNNCLLSGFINLQACSLASITSSSSTKRLSLSKKHITKHTTLDTLLSVRKPETLLGSRENPELAAWRHDLNYFKVTTAKRSGISEE